MKYIDIFLASSITDLHIERMELGNYIRSLNDKFHSLGIYFRLHMCEDLSEEVEQKRKQDTYNEIIEKCDYFYIMVWNRIGKYTLEEFDVAMKKFKDINSPKIMTFFKEVEGDIPKDVMAFMSRMDQELQHYYTKFSSIDSIKLKMILDWASNPDIQMTVEFKDSNVILNGENFSDIDLNKLPFYGNHSAINQLKEELIKIDNDFFDAKKRSRENPDDDSAWQQCFELSKKRTELRENLHKYEMQLLEVSSRFIHVGSSGEYITPRTKKAIALFDEGKIEEALNVLDEEEYLNERNQAIEKAQIINNELKALLKERITKIDIIKAKGITQESAKEIEELYQDASDFEKTYDLGYESRLGYLQFLATQNKYTKAIDLGEKLYFSLKSRDNYKDSLYADVINILSLLYLDTNCLENAEKYSEECLELRKSLNDINSGESFDDDLVSVHINLAAIKERVGKIDEAKSLLIEAISFFEKKLIARHTLEQKKSLATCYNNLATIYQDLGEYEKSMQFHTDALNLRKEIAQNNNDDALNSLANSFHNLSFLCNRCYDFNSAIEYSQEAISIEKRLMQKNFNAYGPSFAYSCVNLANIYKKIDRNEESEIFSTQALSVYTDLYEESPSAYASHLARTYIQIGDIYLEKQKNEEAEKSYFNAITFFEELCKISSSIYSVPLASAYSSLATLYRYNDFQKAETLYLKSIDLYEKTDECSLLAAEYGNLANLYSIHNKDSLATQYFDKATALFESFSKHYKDPRWLENTASMYISLADFYDKISKKEEAELLYKQSIELNEKLYSISPLFSRWDLINSYIGLAVLFCNSYRFDEALNLYYRIKKVQDNRNLTLEFSQSLVGICCALGMELQINDNLEEAEKLYVEAIETSQRISTSDYVHKAYVYKAYEFLGDIKKKQGELEFAEKCYVQAIDAYINEPEAPSENLMDSIRDIYLKLSILYYDTKRMHDSEKCLLECLEIAKELSNINSEKYLPKVALVYNNLGSVYDALGNTSEAIEFHTKALDIRRRHAEKDPDKYLPDVAWSCYKLWLVYSKEHQEIKAQEVASEALSIAKQYSNTNANCKEILHSMNNNDGK